MCGRRSASTSHEHDAHRLWFDFGDASGAWSGVTDDSFATFCAHPGAELLVDDFNAEGQTDLVCRDEGRLWFDWFGWISGLGELDSVVESTFCHGPGQRLLVEDMNADRLADLVCREGTTLTIRFMRSWGNRYWGYEANDDLTLTGVDFCTRPGDTLIDLIDVDGNGMGDLVCHRADGYVTLDRASGDPNRPFRALQRRVSS